GPGSPAASKSDKLAATPGMFVQHSTAAFSDRYKGQRVLGKGSFGEVILCKDKVTGQEYAVKVISKRQVKQKTDKELLLKEVELLKKLDHPNIMKLYEFFEDKGYFYLVTEVYTGGELFDEIISRKRFSEVDAARIIRQVLSGITYMHKNKIVHRDLKPENLLLENKRKDANIRIIDFGLSTHFESTKKMKDKIGTAYYIAPEVLHGTYDEKCDVWSTGVILYILLSGCPPFNGANEFDILKKVEKGKFTFDLPQWKKVSEPAKDLIRKMLAYVPTMRISARDALEHEWLKTTDAATDSIDVPSLESTILNIRQFQGTQKLAAAALLYMGSKLTTNEETVELNKIFQRMDKNGDGQLDKQELMEGYVELMKLKGEDVSALDQSAIEFEVEQVLDAVDFDKNGFIEYSEFVTVAMDRKTLLSRQRLERAFGMFDADGSGKISSSELATIFGVSEVDSETWRRVLAEVDRNNDGEVDFEEFRQMLLKLCGDTAA
uniref:Calmodulin-like domain protein kinase n=1 Tax=Eimeria tenella TaxID=5802 RepID=UPI00078AF31D|nr:Chain A, Calmodulin-like domain protein kinase [Eimeria tenella]4YSJ_B Chain B, Calmodulin-like domain protein kinase [Eimeria tenella]4YSM_A Chain A, Calmodulin-like domain protein kinase [Eimeria tenella]4YSM_B Chain B, Calmodulin-like domain protein kinase [Eimeria tenella]4YUQ_A Chain A, Calmodulin-like domain protein kinase [Eimeria tenella]4YUQ_B Chain B, Calmodulin-like domain protein kinase [Eimeria tenella]4YZB_A Chain A, Calmodulin-like domain protein kinase [Eimeria tenella]4YZ